MRNNKGFTLVEMLIVVAIIGILTAVGIPSLTGQLDRAKAVACEANRVIFMRSYKMNMVFETGDYTLEQAINGEYPVMTQDLAGLTCPSGGTFSVVDGQLVCSVHGAIGSGETGGSGGGTGGDTDTLVAGDVIFGNITLGSWEDLCSAAASSGSGGVSVNKGKVYVYNGETYVAGNDNWLSTSAGVTFSTNPGGVGFMQHFDSTAATLNMMNHNSDDSWTPPLTNGVVFYENDMSFVFLGSDNAYDALPTTGGNWVQLVP
ncbi:MAG: competence type IV pilus major pilin ComGC [Oscillospiraceae bacterium]